MGENKEKAPIQEQKVEKVEKVEKLSYEQLEGVAKQMSAQIDFLVKENQKLKVNMQQLQLANMYTELNLKFEVLKYANFFKPDFVENIVKNIEEIMTPEESEPQEE